jgi:Zn-dependent protease
MQLAFGSSIFTVVVLILSVIIHEVSHGYAAYSLGDPTAKLAGRLTLNPLKHIDPVGSVLIPALLVLTGAGVLFGWAKPVPYNPYNLRNQRFGEAIVAVAGSASNLILALIFGLIARFAFVSSASLDVFGTLAATVALVNLYLGLFNLIPLPPMDGYTVLRGILPYRLSYGLRQFEDRIRAFGAAGIFGILLLFVLFLSGPFSLLVSWVFTALVGQ